MFKIQKDDAFWRPVRVRIPKDDGGVAVHEFRAKFRPMKTGRLREIMEFADAGPAAAEDDDPIHDILIDWEKVQDAEGKELKFSPANVEKLGEIVYVRTAIFESYWEGMSGKKYRAKN